jgi:cyclase
VKNLRLIARLDIKGSNLIKGVHLEGLRVIGDPNEYAVDYYNQGADELIYMDCVASLYGRNHLSKLIDRATQDIFIPITVGGGVRSIDDVQSILRSGADKVAINTGAVQNPKLITEVANRYGTQCIVLSIEAKKISSNRWEVLTDNGREKTGLDVMDWAKIGEEAGAGEILVTSIDREGTRTGFDLDLLSAVASIVDIPIIASGGMGAPEDVISAANIGNIEAIAMADIIHYKRSSFSEIRKVAMNAGIKVRVDEAI